MNNLSEKLGRRVREVWVKWAKEQENPKKSWLVEYDDLDEKDKEVDRRIGLAIWGDCINEYQEAISEFELRKLLNDSKI